MTAAPTRHLPPVAAVKGSLKTISRFSKTLNPTFSPGDFLAGDETLTPMVTESEEVGILGERRAAMKGPGVVDTIQLESTLPCCSCSLFIEEGKVIEFDGLYCHESCFVCANCGKPCDLEEFYHDTVSFFCPDCKTHLRPRCHYCTKFITKTLLRDNETLEPFHEECYPKWEKELLERLQREADGTASESVVSEVDVPTLAEFAKGRKASNAAELTPVAHIAEIKNTNDRANITPEPDTRSALVRQFKREVIPDAPRTPSVSHADVSEDVGVNHPSGRPASASTLLNELWTSVQSGAPAPQPSPATQNAVPVPDYAKETARKESILAPEPAPSKPSQAVSSKTALKQPLLSDAEGGAAGRGKDKSGFPTAGPMEGFSAGCSLRQNAVMIAIAVLGGLLLITGVILAPLASNTAVLGVGIALIILGVILIAVPTALTRLWRRAIPIFQ